MAVRRWLMVKRRWVMVDCRWLVVQRSPAVGVSWLTAFASFLRVGERPSRPFLSKVLHFVKVFVGLVSRLPILRKIERKTRENLCPLRKPQSMA